MEETLLQVQLPRIEAILSEILVLVRIDRIGAQKQILGDPPLGLSRDELLQNYLLTRGELLVVRGHVLLREDLQHFARYRRGHHRPAPPRMTS